MNKRYQIIYDLGYGHFNVRMKDTIEANEYSMYKSRVKIAKKMLETKHPNRTFMIVNIKPAESDIEL